MIGMIITIMIMIITNNNNNVYMVTGLRNDEISHNVWPAQVLLLPKPFYCRHVWTPPTPHDPQPTRRHTGIGLGCKTTYN